MSYCLQCGALTKIAIPSGDNHERVLCDTCGYIHYENPKMVCGTLAVHDGKILLCRRAIEPRYGLWTLPAGFMEIGETMADGARREMVEEADGVAVGLHLYRLFDIPKLGQIHAMYLSVLQDGLFGVGAESLECRLFTYDEIDLPNLAFETVRQTIMDFYADKNKLIQAGLDWMDFRYYTMRERCIHQTRSD